MKILLISLLIVLSIERVKKTKKNKKTIFIQQLDQIPCPTLYFLKDNEDDDLDHRRIGNETCTHCTIYSGCPDGQSCLRGLSMEAGPSIHSGVCMRLQDIYDHLNEIENNSLNFRTLFQEPELISEVSSKTFRTQFTRSQRTILIKKVIKSETSTKERKQRMVMTLGGKNSMPPTAAEFVLDAIPPQDLVLKEQMNNIIENGAPYYFNEFSPIEQVKPLGLDLSSLPPLNKGGDSYVEPPLIKYNDLKLVGKKEMLIMPDEKNDEGKEIRFGEPFIRSADPEEKADDELQAKIPEKIIKMVGNNKCSIPPGCDSDGNPIDIKKELKEARKLKKKHHKKK